MRIALALAYRLGDVVVEPLGICELGGYLRREGFDVGLFDVNQPGFDEDRLLDAILAWGPGIVGISNPWELGEAQVRHFSRRLRDAGFEGLVLVGGIAPSLAAEAYLGADSAVDAVVVGEGEVPCATLARRYAAGEDWRTTRGIAYRDAAGVVRSTGSSEVVQDMDELPYAARDILAEHVRLLGSNAMAALSQSRGCYKRCSFCCTQQLYRSMEVKVHRRRSMPHIVDEMRRVYDAYGVFRFSFEDDQFLVPGPTGARQVAEFHRLVQALPFRPWLRMAARVDSMTDETLGAMEECGLRHIFTGIETFNDADLVLYFKESTVHDLTSGMERLRERGWSAKAGSEKRLECGFIAFNPFSTVQGLRDNLRWARHFDIPFTMLTTRLEMYKGTALKAHVERTSSGIKAGGYFDRPEIDALYRAWVEGYYHGFVRAWRKPLRTAEKLGLDTDGAIRAFRQWVDVRSYDVLVELLDLAEAGAGRARLDAHVAAVVDELTGSMRTRGITRTLRLLQDEGRPIGVEMR